MIELLQRAMPHLVAVPVVLPMATAAAMLLLAGRRRGQAALGIVSATLGLAVAIALLHWTQWHGTPGTIGVYLPANWHVPFGIVLVLDRLSALMLVLTALLGVATLLFAAARWDRAGVHFGTLAQIQLMGLNGAFLTGDLFNLFVFFELTLAASYGLMLHGSGRGRVRHGLRYLALNLLASWFFLVGVAILYGITGTLNMADMAGRLVLVPAGDLGLAHAGAAILGVAFLLKAAAWPLNQWLVPAYGCAAAPVAALFAVLTKMGLYALLRMWTLLVSASPSGPVLFAGDALIYVGLATLAMGTVGILTVHQPRHLAGYGIVMSAGTLLAATGFGDAALVGAALFYLVVATIACSALFLLAELIERSRQTSTDAPVLHDDEAGDVPAYVVPDLAERRGALDEEAPVGQAFPGALAFLGLAFIACAMLIAGLPPLSGFVAKVAMLAALLGYPETAGNAAASMSGPAWALLALLIASGLVATIAFSRAGVRFFWAPQGRPTPHLRVVEVVPVAALILCAIALTVRPEPALRFSRSAADALFAAAPYIETVRSAAPVPRRTP